MPAGMGTSHFSSVRLPRVLPPPPAALLHSTSASTSAAASSSGSGRATSAAARRPHQPGKQTVPDEFQLKSQSPNSRVGVCMVASNPATEETGASEQLVKTGAIDLVEQSLEYIDIEPELEEPETLLPKRSVRQTFIDELIAVESECQADSNPTSLLEHAAQLEMPREVHPEQSRPRHVSQFTVLLQGFHWNSHALQASTGQSWYSYLLSRIPDLASAGITHIWLPPPSKSVAPQGYMPQAWFDLNTAYGSQDELKHLIRKLKEAGITPLADLVLNHRCGDRQDENGIWNQYSNECGKQALGPNVAEDWGAWAVVCDDAEYCGTGNPDTGERFGGAPDLDHANAALRNYIAKFLNWLKEEIGFEGWRFDYVKGFGADFIKEYVENSQLTSAYHIGELWKDCKYDDKGRLVYDQNDNRQMLAEWVKAAGSYVTAFDFTLKAVLQEAVEKGQYSRLVDLNRRPFGLVGIRPGMATTFLDNHDTGHTCGGYGQGHWAFPAGKELVGYAYIFTHPGVPTVFCQHFLGPDPGQPHNIMAGCGWPDTRPLIDSIKLLIDIRRRNGICADATVNILACEDDIYMASIADDLLRVKLGPRYELHELEPSDQEFTLAAHGTHYAIWERKHT
eukprot:jgi/Chlat1/2079/Chrsp17S02811